MVEGVLPKRIFILVVASALGTALAVGGLELADDWSSSPLIRSIRGEDKGTWEIFFSVFGLIYAIIVGLFIIEAHRRIRDLSTAVQSELNAIGDINDFLTYFEGEAENRLALLKVRGALSAYAENEIINDLDPKERRHGSQTDERRREIRAIITSVSSLQPVDDNDKYALDAIINKVGELTTFRAQKTEVARRGFPRIFYVLLWFMALVTVSGFVLMELRSPELHSLLVAITALVTTWLVLLVWDLDRPLDGYWNIRQELTSNVSEIRARLARRGGDVAA